MPTAIQWSITLEQYDTAIDITDRVVGASIDQIVEVGAMGTGHATVQFLNNDGAFTPGNGGTYSDLNAYSYALIIKCTFDDGVLSPYTARVYAGLVTRFELLDDGINSTIQLDADDAYTIAGQSKVKAVDLDPNVWTFYFAGLTYLYNGYTYDGQVLFNPVDAPLLGADDYSFFTLTRDVATNRFRMQYVDYVDYTVSDLVNSAVLPCGPAVAFPTNITFTGNKVFYYSHVYDGPSVRFFPTFEVPIKFAENPTGDELPFKNLDRGYNVDDVVNSAEITRNNPTQYSGAPTETRSHENTESIQQYGIRNVQYGAVAQVWDVATVQNGELEPGALENAQRWANRYSVPRFLTRQLQVTQKQVEIQDLTELSAMPAWRNLLDVSTGVWKKTHVTYTPTGGTERTDHVVTTSRRIDITPNDVTVTIDFKPLVDNLSFTLDVNDLGVLGGTLDTYDDTDYTYDEFFPYNGHPVEGNRLY